MEEGREREKELETKTEGGIVHLLVHSQAAGLASLTLVAGEQVFGSNN